MIEFLALLALLATPYYRPQPTPVGHMSGSSGLENLSDLLPGVAASL
jgi:hypothetical protein